MVLRMNDLQALVRTGKVNDSVIEDSCKNPYLYAVEELFILNSISLYPDCSKTKMVLSLKPN